MGGLDGVFTVGNPTWALYYSSVIRTIRDMYYTWHSSTNFKKIDTQKQHDILQQLVTIYNNTYHTSIKMKPVEMF